MLDSSDAWIVEGKRDLGLDCFGGLFIGGITSLNEWYG